MPEYKRRLSVVYFMAMEGMLRRNAEKLANQSFSKGMEVSAS